MDKDDVLTFWFSEVTPAAWFKKDDAVDHLITLRFGNHLEAARRGELYRWRDGALGRLAEIILLDQFSRNIYRGKKEAFALDPMALVLSQELVMLGLDIELGTEEKAFAYMPYMHSESPLIHREAVILFSKPGLEDNLKFEHRHKEIIDRFGRYPHRNAVLGRISTPEEIEFLKTHSGF